MLDHLKILIHIVTFNNEKTILTCIKSLIEQADLILGKDYQIIVSDNCSSDNTFNILIENFSEKILIRKNSHNLGFCGAHNYAATYIVRNKIPFLLLINPDLKIENNCLKILAKSLENDSISGAACPKSYRADSNLNPINPLTFDSTGMFITPEIRHFDRGSNEIDRKQFDRTEYVFGSSGSMMLLKNDFIQDVALNSDEVKKGDFKDVLLFDPSFFAYREDADLAWRMQYLGWKCLYQPKAIAYHQRKVLPENRAELNEEINAYGVKNRFLLQFNNYSLLNNFKEIPFTIWRNIFVILAVLIKEKSSIPALRSASQLFPVARRNFLCLKKRQRVPSYEINKWFSCKPFSEPALEHNQEKSPIKTISAIVVNYNSHDRLLNCVKSLALTAKELTDKVKFNIFIFDNNSSDKSLEILKNSIDLEGNNIVLIESKENHGFAGAINQCIKQISADAFLILNPDIAVNSQALEELKRALESYQEIAAISPILKNKSGEAQYKYLLKNFPSFGSTIAELLFLHRLFPKNIFTQSYDLSENQLYKNYILKEKTSMPFFNLEKPLLIPQPAAACLLIRANDLKQVNGFDQDFYPAWFEDVDFAKRLFNQNRFCAITNKAEVIHEGGYSADGLDKKKFHDIWYNNLTLYWKKHGLNYQYLCIKFLSFFSKLIKSSLSK